MGAECEKHGVDLHGHSNAELVCPVCDLEAKLEFHMDPNEPGSAAHEINRLAGLLADAERELQRAKTERFNIVHNDLIPRARRAEAGLREAITWIEDAAEYAGSFGAQMGKTMPWTPARKGRSLRVYETGRKLAKELRRVVPPE